MQPCLGQSPWRNGGTPRNKFQSDQTSAPWKKYPPLQLARDEKVSFREVSSPCHFKGKLLAGHRVRDVAVVFTVFSLSLFSCFITGSKALLFKNDNPLVPEFRQFIHSQGKEYFPESWMVSASELHKAIWPITLTDASQATSTSSDEIGHLRMLCSSLSHWGISKLWISIPYQGGPACSDIFS